MDLYNEILINQYGQSIIVIDIILDRFKVLNIDEKRFFLNDFLSIIMQSKPNDSDIQDSIRMSNLKSSYTPCIMLKKGVTYHNLIKIVNLPENELEKSLILLLSLFKIAYQRRFIKELNAPNKWWYWDLSKQENIDCILNNES